MATGLPVDLHAICNVTIIHGESAAGLVETS